MKKYLIGFVIGLILAAAVGLIYVNLKTKALQGENAQLKADYSALQNTTITLENANEKKIKAAMNQIASLTAKNDTLAQEKAGLVEKIMAQENKVATLHEQNKILLSQVQPVIDGNPALTMYVQNLHLEIGAQAEEIFTLKESVKNAEARAANSEAKFQAQSVISEAYKADWLSEKDLRLKGETRQNQLEKTVATLNLRPKWGTVALGGGTVVAAVAVVAVLVFGHR